MAAEESPRKPSGNDALALQLLRTNTWSCYYGLPLWKFTSAKLKEIMRGLLSELPDSKGRKPRLLSRPCNVLSDHGRQGEEAFFCVASAGSRKPHAAGLVHSNEKVSLVFLAGSVNARTLLAYELGNNFGVTLLALQLAPWQLSMVAVWGLSFLEPEDPSLCCLELNMDGVIMAFSAEVLGQLPPPSRRVTVEDGRNFLLALCKHVSKHVLPHRYQELPLRSVHFLNLFLLDHEGTVLVHKTTLVTRLFKYLLFTVEQAVLGDPPKTFMLEDE
ncbi:uncharacterized protein [Dermacentor andersoni]|uniref:uncharacterized protein n=1 Tax=Dermacentor andersoni TaxID=34620 RepID=UPI0021552717|nr:uncharacterized protein LOC126530623 [Dermacentor andersoni]XP_050033849.1 uncharacterized protein LOC126530623 [Dermacentor andersoni]XP_050033850.1 uncharacterized protein LOC126530623 [Dermacentor andersoni]XP_054926645.1 uncharacterized protein LOC126530623 [Dermacentor andersoni]XP_054926646.1 uncharacterized protein LOC126530623 [Dermacentor andersoni]